MEELYQTLLQRVVLLEAELQECRRDLEKTQTADAVVAQLPIQSREMEKAMSKLHTRLCEHEKKLSRDPR